ncbi:phosphate acyltransferase, partial [Bacillus velezensis]|uniref:phosphate acyltransferase n=1 Tax=Bacillus velezensis TaxID=492670 RepID=UPI0021B5975C
WGKSDEREKVGEGVKIGKEKGGEVRVEGELELEGGFVGCVGEKKGGEWEIKGEGNVFVLGSVAAGKMG